jgi:hypothetical protein
LRLLQVRRPDLQRLADLRVRWRFQQMRLRGCWWLLPEHSHWGQWLELEQQCCWPWCQCLAPEDLPERWRFQQMRPLGCWWLLREHSHYLDRLLAPWSWQKPLEFDQPAYSVRWKPEDLPVRWRFQQMRLPGCWWLLREHSHCLDLLPERLRPYLKPDCSCRNRKSY